MQRYQHRFKAMGGPCQLRLDCADDAAAMHAIAGAETEVKRLEQKYSRYIKSSALSLINANAGKSTATAIDAETHSLLEYADTLWQQSAGLFDITSGVLRRAWDFRAGVLPQPEQLLQLLPLIGWDQVRVATETVELPQPGMELDFGGFVKEYACDAAARVLQDSGIAHGLVDLAGDFSVFGGQASGQPWTIAIRKPPQSADEPVTAIAEVVLMSGGLATSGDYERCIEIDGQRYGHILNPATGMPVAGFTAVSVIAEHCLIAGSAATVGLLKPEQEASAWLNELGLAWLAIDTQLRSHGNLLEA